MYQFSSVQLLSRVWLFVTPWTAALQASLSITNSRSSPKPMSIKSVMPSNHLILCCPLLLLPSIFPNIRVFSNESALHIRSPKYWSFSLSISPFNEYLGLISFRMDWLNLLAVQGTLKSLLQHHSWKASILLCSAFFIVQLSHPYMTIGKTIPLTRQSFVGKVMSLLFNMLSRLVITFFPRSKFLEGNLLMDFNFMAALTICSDFGIMAAITNCSDFGVMAAITICSDFGVKKNKVSQCFHCFPIYLPWTDGTRCRDVTFLSVEL